MGEVEHSHRIFYGIPDVLGRHRHRYKNKSVVVVGGGHSAINTLLELDKLKEAYPDTQIHWVLRKKHVKEVYGGQEADGDAEALRQAPEIVRGLLEAGK